MPITAFGDFLCQQLSQRGWSQRRFAALVGVNQAQLGRIVRGERRPPLDRMQAWAEALALDDAAARELARLALVEHEAAWIAGQIRAPRRAAEGGLRYERGRRP